MEYQLSGLDRLVLDKAPFSLRIMRGSDTLLASHAIHVDVVGWQTETQGDQQSHQITFADARRLTLTLRPRHLVIRWQADSADFVFDIGAYWYGQGEFINQQWPLNNMMLQRSQLITVDNGETGLSCIQSPVWLNSSGLALISNSPIEVAFNAPPEHYTRYTWGVGFGNVAGPFDQRPYSVNEPNGSGHFEIHGQDLSFDLFVEPDIKQAHRAVVKQIGRITQIPPAALIEKPIWNTWARFHADINQKIVLQYAQEIVDHGYPRSRFVIDDKWQQHYGDLWFDAAKFPDPRHMVDKLHTMGFEVNTWVIPFITEHADSFSVAAGSNYLVRTQTGEPYQIEWWQGYGYLLDVTNPAALDWFLNNLRTLQRATGLDGFKFDAGEAIFLPEDAVTFEPVDRNEYTRRYIDFVGQHFPWSDVRSGWRNESAPVLFRQWDKASTWGLDNGLHSVLTGALSLSLSGYPLFLPDMIGGNAYSQHPSEELMIRWAQLNALMPGMQFSLAPWDYGPQATELCLKSTQLHQRFSDYIMQCIEHATQSGAPIIRPMFWAMPSLKDEVDLFEMDDQFMLGDRFIISPVLAEGQRERDIFLPAGRWKDYWQGTYFDGPINLTSYPTPLDTLPIFEVMD